MSRRTRTQAAVLSASERVCDLFVSLGTTDLTVAKLSRELELNERTFYRYFATKEQVVQTLWE